MQCSNAFTRRADAVTTRRRTALRERGRFGQNCLFVIISSSPEIAVGFIPLSIWHVSAAESSKPLGKLHQFIGVKL
jgi:hypothetical protein